MIKGVCEHCGSEGQLFIEKEWYGWQISCLICGWDKYDPIEPANRDLRREKEGNVDKYVDKY